MMLNEDQQQFLNTPHKYAFIFCLCCFCVNHNVIFATIELLAKIYIPISCLFIQEKDFFFVKRKTRYEKALENEN